MSLKIKCIYIFILSCAAVNTILEDKRIDRVREEFESAEHRFTIGYFSQAAHNSKDICASSRPLYRAPRSALCA